MMCRIRSWSLDHYDVTARDAFERAGAPCWEVVYPRFFSVRSSFFFESGPVALRETKASASDSKFHWMYLDVQTFLYRRIPTICTIVEHMRVSSILFG